MDLRDLAAIKAIRIINAVIHRHRDLCQTAASIKGVASDVDISQIIAQCHFTDSRASIKTIRPYRSLIDYKRLSLLILILIPSLISKVPRIDQADVVLIRMSMEHRILDLRDIIIRIHKQLQQLQTRVIDGCGKDDLIIDKFNRLVDILLL